MMMVMMMMMVMVMMVIVLIMITTVLIPRQSRCDIVGRVVFQLIRTVLWDTLVGQSVRHT